MNVSSRLLHIAANIFAFDIYIYSPTTENKYLERAALESLRLVFALQGTQVFVEAQQAVGPEQRFLPVITIILLGDNAFYCQPEGHVRSVYIYA